MPLPIITNLSLFMALLHASATAFLGIKKRRPASYLAGRLCPSPVLSGSAAFIVEGCALFKLSDWLLQGLCQLCPGAVFGPLPGVLRSALRALRTALRQSCTAVVPACCLAGRQPCINSTSNTRLASSDSSARPRQTARGSRSSNGRE